MCADTQSVQNTAQNTAADGAHAVAALHAAAEQHITRARAALVMEHPFFGSLALRLRLKADPNCADMWTDGKTLAYNPVFATALSPKSLVGAMAHEVLHLAFGHHLRRKGRDASQWNRACDLAINHILLETGFTLPQGFAHNPAYAGMNADEIFEALVNLQDAPANKGAKSAQAVQGTEKTEGAGAGSFEGGKQQELASQPQSTQGSRQQDEQKDQTPPQATAGNKAAQRGKGKQEQSEGKVSFIGEVADHPDAQGAQNDQALKAAQQEADIAMMQALQRARHMGSMPAGLARQLNHAWRPKLDWQSLLQRFLEQCAQNDYSWTSPNRRYLYQNIYLPARREARLPHVALAVDCSGSVDEQALAMFCAELTSVLDAYDTTLTVLYHDTKVQKTETLTRMDMPATLTPVGGGGTDYRPVCTHIEDENLQPTCLIWFTDLECNRYPAEPEYPVLWVCSAKQQEQPPFGQVLYLAPDAFMGP
ncbi:MAG: hypothetical protein EOM56_10595 [Deltaproteobacteria bacterium]|nr:hypothetical protein [Deltaproteobacteria bacterium]